LRLIETDGGVTFHRNLRKANAHDRVKHRVVCGLYRTMSALTSATLSFSRDGRRLLVADHDAVTVIDTVTQTPCRLAIDTPLSVIGFADQIWIAHGRSPQLSRFGVTGSRIAVPQALPATGGELIAAAASLPAALWTGDPGFAISEEQGATRVEEAPAGDLVLPLTSRRWVIASGARVTLPSGLSCDLGAGARVAAGVIALDGTALLALVERPNAREIIVVGLGNGRVQLRHVIVASRVRIAARRGLVAAQLDADRIGIVELRSGRMLGEIASEKTIIDFALDPDGHHIATRSIGEIAVELLDLRRALEPRRVAAPAELVEEPAPVAVTQEQPAVVPEPPHPPGSLHLARPLDLAALAPVQRRSEVDRTTALELLDREMRTVALRTLVAISHAWDTRRIGYGNEGHHPFEHEVAALLGMNVGFAKQHVAAARAHLAAHEAVCTTALRARDHAMPLGALALELGLSPLALDILLVVAAPTLWSDAARLFGVLANDGARALVDEALVAQILATHTNRHDIATELDARAPLVRLGIVTVDGARRRPFAALAVDAVVLARLRRETPDLAGVEVRTSDRALEELIVTPPIIEGAVATLARCSGPARIAVRGRRGSGRRTLVAALAAEAGRPIGVIDATTLRRETRAAALQLALRRVHLAGLLPCVVGLADIMAGEQHESEAVIDVLRTHPGPVAVVQSPEDEVPFEAGHVNIDLPLLAETDRVALWRSALAEAALDVADPTMLAARYRIGPGVIYRAIRDARKASDGHAYAMPVIETYLRQARDARLGAHARRVERLGSWDTLVLPPDIRDSLRELIARVRHRRTVFETWGMDRHVATSRGLTALFSGPPGTGKTLVAGVIARELGLDLYQVELSKLMSKWIGETERNLATIFDAAEDGQAILLFDEADSLFAKRTEVRSSNDRYANLEVNYLLQRLDSFEGIAILTTNAVSAIDPAFKRRLSFRLSFPFPDEETREQLWRAHLPDTLPIAGPLALDRLAHKYQLSGGYIRNACLRAAFLAAQDETALAQSHLERAVALEFAELGKLSSGGSLD
jgi:hypothetical protein